MAQNWALLIGVVIVASFGSMLGGIIMLGSKRLLGLVNSVAVPFAAGALLAAAFYDLLPEALEGQSIQTMLLMTLLGFIFFFLMERFLHWFHHHHEDADDEPEHGQHGRGSENKWLIIIGDLVHNFIDGLAIGATFLASPAAGIVTTFAVAAHEVPKEIGTFGLLYSKGMSRRAVIGINALTALFTIIAACLVYAFGGVFDAVTPYVIASTAGFFLYIAASDIIPSIHAQAERKLANIQTIWLLLGTAAVIAAITLTRQLFNVH